ncbi:hypothetical protein EDD86DRAFT_245828 [Gorgonomyces haynaldii]|nr:hypothetical protein EDD86DRAFT_245828 [Gorgonomyces haynaldii]
MPESGSLVPTGTQTGPSQSGTQPVPSQTEPVQTTASQPEPLGSGSAQPTGTQSQEPESVSSASQIQSVQETSISEALIISSVSAPPPVAQITLSAPAAITRNPEVAVPTFSADPGKPTILYTQQEGIPTSMIAFPSTTPFTDGNSSVGSSGGMTVGVVIGVVIGSLVLIVGFVAALVFRRVRRNDQRAPLLQHYSEPAIVTSTTPDLPNTRSTNGLDFSLEGSSATGSQGNLADFIVPMNYSDPPSQPLHLSGKPLSKLNSYYSHVVFTESNASLQEYKSEPAKSGQSPYGHHDPPSAVSLTGPSGDTDAMDSRNTANSQSGQSTDPSRVGQSGNAEISPIVCQISSGTEETYSVPYASSHSYTPSAVSQTYTPSQVGSQAPSGVSYHGSGSAVSGSGPTTGSQIRGGSAFGGSQVNGGSAFGGSQVHGGSNVSGAHGANPSNVNVPGHYNLPPLNIPEIPLEAIHFVRPPTASVRRVDETTRISTVPSGEFLTLEDLSDED